MHSKLAREKEASLFLPPRKVTAAPLAGREMFFFVPNGYRPPPLINHAGIIPAMQASALVVTTLRALWARLAFMICGWPSDQALGDPVAGGNIAAA